MSAFTSPNRFSRLIHFDSYGGPLASSFCCPRQYSLLSCSSSSFPDISLLRGLRVSACRPSRRHFISASAAELPPDTSMEVVKSALKRCSAQPGSVAIRSHQKSYSYAQLISSARKISNLLCAGDLSNASARCTNGVSSISAGVAGGVRSLDGARIGIVAKPSAEFVAGVFGTWLGGGVAVPLAVSYPESELLHVMNDSVCSYPFFLVPIRSGIKLVVEYWNNKPPEDCQFDVADVLALCSVHLVTRHLHAVQTHGFWDLNFKSDFFASLS